MSASTAIQVLKKQFPNVPQNAIQNVLQDQCNGDANQAIVILMKIAEFNRSMNTQPQSAAPQQVIIQSPVQQQLLSPSKIPLIAQTVEGTQDTNPNIISPVQVIQVPLQPAPLQIINPNNSHMAIRQRHPHWSLNLDHVPGCNSCCDATNCPCCLDCCPSCYMIPDKYENGLYPIDLKVKNIAFIIFVTTSIYAEYSLKILDSPIQHYYISVIALLMIGVSAVLFYSKLNRVMSVGFIIGGLLYFISYIGYGVTLSTYNVCDQGGEVCYCYSNHECECANGDSGYDECDYYWNDGDDYRWVYRWNPLYFFMRGALICYHCILMGMHYDKPACNNCNNRLSLIRLDSVMFALFVGLVLSWVITTWLFIIAFSGMIPCWLAILFFINVCIAQPLTNKGGCTGFSITGILLIIFYSVFIIIFLSFSLDQVIHDGYYIKPNIFSWVYWLWEFVALTIFSTLNFWIYLRMIHPTFGSCCVKKIQQDIIVSI